MSIQPRHPALLLFCSLLAAPVSEALAVEPLDTFSARIGGYITRFDTDVRADGETQNGTPLNLDRDLGLDDSNTIAYVSVAWRPWDKHEFGVAYYQDDADATRVLQRDIVFEGTTYETAATIRAEISRDTYEAYYTWWAASHDNWALGPRFGLVWYRLQMGISLEADANGNPVGGTVSNKVDADLPAPTIGGSWRWTPAEDWRISADAGYFQAEIGNVDADVAYGRLSVEWFPWERTGFSLDYTATRVEADASKANFSGNMDLVDSGIRAGVVYRF